MPRKARKRSASGIYHIVTRGINRQDIFHEDEDYRHYLQILKQIKREDKCEIYGYCLMTNHVHLLIKEENEDISKIMKRIGVKYAGWYNWKYERSGHVFQGRFKSECVEDENYLLTVIRYIHANPVKAGIVKKSEDYYWSSCSRYYKGRKNTLVNPEFILDLFGTKKVEAIDKFEKFMRKENDDRCLDLYYKEKIKDKILKEEIIRLLNGKPLDTLQKMNKEDRDKILKKIKSIKGSTLRQIARLTGVGVYTIHKA